jgi:hypothetical protein
MPATQMWPTPHSAATARSKPFRVPHPFLPKRVRLSGLNYSYRNATIGSTLIARRAGM